MVRTTTTASDYIITILKITIIMESKKQTSDAVKILCLLF